MRTPPTIASGSGAADLGKLGLTLAPAARVAGAGAEGVVVTGVDSSGSRRRSRLSRPAT